MKNMLGRWAMREEIMRLGCILREIDNQQSPSCGARYIFDKVFCDQLVVDMSIHQIFCKEFCEENNLSFSAIGNILRKIYSPRGTYNKIKNR